MDSALRQNQTTAQRQTLAPQMRQSLRLLQMDIGELREALYREMAENPVLDDVEQTLDSRTTGEMERASDARELADASDWPDDGGEGMDEYYAADADAVERRRRFFDSRTRAETLEEHLRAQVGMTDLDEDGQALALTLIGSLDADGRFSGSIPDLMMVTGASEAQIRATLAVIAGLDPPGCGTTSLEECLLAQIDARDDIPFRDDVRELVSNHLADLAARDFAKIREKTGMDEARLSAALALLRTLEPHPGRAFASSDEAIVVKPEVHAVFEQGRWTAVVDERDKPEIHVSSRYLAMLANPKTDVETRAYIRRKLETVNEIAQAIERRSETIQAVAQAIFDAQPGFFEKGLPGLVPLTMMDIAGKVGVHHTTVSRTVNGKYASTPFGTVELRRFFVAGVATEHGEAVAKSAVTGRLARLVEEEDKENPLSDERLAQLLKKEGFAVARRTVAKYRTQLGIPGAVERKSKI